MSRGLLAELRGRALTTTPWLAIRRKRMHTTLNMTIFSSNLIDNRIRNWRWATHQIKRWQVKNDMVDRWIASGWSWGKVGFSKIPHACDLTAPREPGTKCIACYF